MNDKITETLEGAADVPDPRPPAFSESALALSFAEQHAGDLRYVAAWNKWLSWDGRRWRFDTVLRTFDLAHVLCRRAAAECNKKNAKELARAKTVAAVISLARADPRIAATDDQWDADPWLLNTPGGVVDLKTGERRPPRPGDYMTKITAVAPDGRCPCPRWDAFLKKIAPDELEKYLDRAFGYALTGSTKEQVLFFLHGLGKNGKTVFVETVAGVMGDYHTTAPIETFMATDNPQHPTDLAGLQGARLVTAVETEKGRRWAQSRVNMMTGGEKITARFMRQDFFTYTPQFKLAIYGNHKPALRSVNEAIRRRMNLLPFTVTIPEKERDKDLIEKLREEWSGILQRLVDGCLEWQRDGLAPPKIVNEATEKYLTDEDAPGAWIEDRCDLNSSSSEQRSKLFASWRSWAENAKEFVGSQRQFYAALEERGFKPKKIGGVRKFEGLKLKPYQEEPLVEEERPAADPEMPF